MRRIVFRVLLLSIICASSVFAQEVSPSVQLDFSKSDGRTVRDALNPDISYAIYLGDIEECGRTKVLSFDAITHIVLENTRDLDFGKGITITAWICPDKMRRNTIVVGRPNPNRDWTIPTLGLYFPSHNRLGMGIWSSNKCRLEADTEITVGKWIFAACTWDRKTAKIYINGKLKGEEACTGKLPKLNVPFGIGCGNPANPFFKGKLGEVRIFERAIPGAAIDSLYQASRTLYPESVLTKPTTKMVTVKAKVKPESEWNNFPTERWTVFRI